jgi:2-C-methyl-D-erythritol 4-phosphate cytidylyltransferase
MVHVTWGLIIACGKSEELAGGADIPFLTPGDSPLLSYSLVAYERCSEIDGVVVVANRDKLEMVANMVRLYGCDKVRKIVTGTSQRYGSLLNGLKILDEAVTIVSVHEASRPCVTADLVGETVKAAKRYGSGVAAVRVEDSALQVEKGQKASKALDFSKLWLAQTPQTFRRDLLEKAWENAQKRKLRPRDDAEAFLAKEKEVHVVPSTSNNMKVRSADDLVVAAALLRVQ